MRRRACRGVLVMGALGLLAACAEPIEATRAWQHCGPDGMLVTFEHDWRDGTDPGRAWTRVRLTVDPKNISPQTPAVLQVLHNCVDEPLLGCSSGRGAAALVMASKNVGATLRLDAGELRVGALASGEILLDNADGTPRRAQLRAVPVSAGAACG